MPTLRGTSAFARNVTTLLAVPPGQQATSTSLKRTGCQQVPIHVAAVAELESGGAEGMPSGCL